MAVLRYKSGGTWYDLTVGMDQGAADARYVKKAGDSMTGPLTLPGAPTSALHAATKAYVDSKSSHEGRYYGVVTASQSLPNNSDTALALTGYAAVYCTQLNSYQIRIDVGGHWLLSAQVALASSSVGAGRAYVQWALGAWVIGRQPWGRDESYTTCTALTLLTAGQVVHVSAYHQAGSTLTTLGDQLVAMKWLGP